MSVNEINKIYIQDSIQIENVGMSTLLFCNRKAISKKQYSIVDHVLNVTDSIDSTVNLLVNTGSLRYYEYKLVLTMNNVEISGYDEFKNTIPLITTQRCLIFINGVLITSDDYIIENGKIIITSRFGTEQGSEVIILLSPEIQYQGTVYKEDLLNQNTYTLSIYQYTADKYIFFKNGELINKNEITLIDESTIQFNTPIYETDTITYYTLPVNSINYFFEAVPGYLTYGPIDDYNKKIPDIYDTKITFSRAARLAVDDIRKGMIIAEESGTGSAIIIDEEFETATVRCIRLTNFSSSFYTPNTYYIQVPEARSILKYISEYDLQKTLFPELLTTFQKLLLNETYDSIQRLKNIRNMNKVDSIHITKLLDLLGLKIDVTDMTIEQKHSILDELNNFHRKVGTRASYNYYNKMTNNSKIIKLEQLFTPIKDTKIGEQKEERYITFKTAEEIDPTDHPAKYKEEYVVDATDYGSVNELANTDDTYRNTDADTVRSEGILDYPAKPHVFNSPRTVYYINAEGNSVSEEEEILLNLYITNPLAGPNQPTIDYGSIAETEQNVYDYGKVSEPVTGHWIKWLDWERPKNWYPTNHVQLSAEIPPGMAYDDFIEEFKRVFYDIASAVIYIHSLIEIYVFGGNEGEGSGGGIGGGSKNNAGYFAINVCGSPFIDTQEYSFTSDPERQIAPDQMSESEVPDPVVPDYLSTYDRRNDIITLTEYIGIQNNITTPNEF